MSRLVLLDINSIVQIIVLLFRKKITESQNTFFKIIHQLLDFEINQENPAQKKKKKQCVKI